MKILSGLLLCSILALLAKCISSIVPFGAVTVAIMIGALYSNIFKLKESTNVGIGFCEKQILGYAIALMGINLNYTILHELGPTAFLIVLLGLLVVFASFFILVKIFAFDFKLALLLSIGNGICGSSAIAASNEIISAKKEDMAIAIATINFLGTIGIFVLPAITFIVFKQNSEQSGVLIGNTLQAVGQVVAAGFTISEDTGQIATLVKMTRILMLAPILILLGIFLKGSGHHKAEKKKILPGFIIGFIFFSLLSTTNLLPESLTEYISFLSKLLLIIAMTAIGLRISIGNILKNGLPALLFGVIIFSIQIIFNIFVISLYL